MQFIQNKNRKMRCNIIQYLSEFFVYVFEDKCMHVRYEMIRKLEES